MISSQLLLEGKFMSGIKKQVQSRELLSARRIYKVEDLEMIEILLKNQLKINISTLCPYLPMVILLLEEEILKIYVFTILKIKSY